MKYLIQIPQLIYGGAEKVLVSFANCLAAHGHEVEILEIYEKGLLKPQFDPRVTFHAICSDEYKEKYYASLSEIKQEKNIGKKLLKCGKQVFSKAVGYRSYAEKIAAKHYAGIRFDVAVNYLETETPAFLLDNISADKYFQWIHTDVSNENARRDTDRLKPYFDRLDKIFCVSEYARKSFCRAYQGLDEKVVTLYNFFDADEITSKSREPFSFGSDAPVLLSVGRMTEQKAYPRFLRVLKRLRDESYSFVWHVLGTGVESEKIYEKINEYGLCDRVFLHGVTDNPYKYMRACDIFVLPSEYEGFPTVTVEAKLIGCPVLATDVSGIREQLVDGKTGLIVENSEQGLYEGLKRLLGDDGLREALGCNDGIDKLTDNEFKYREIIEISEG